jgi:hypothetical protein
MSEGMRKGIWLGVNDLFLIEEAKKQRRSFSDFAKVAMHYYVEQHALAVEQIADAVVERLLSKGLVLSANGVVVEPTGEQVDILRKSMVQLLS